MDRLQAASSNVPSNVVLGTKSTRSVEPLVSPTTEAAADDFLHDLGGAPEDRLDAAEPPELTIVPENSGLCSRRSRPGSLWSARVMAFARCDLGGDHAPGDRLAASQLPEPRRGPDDHAEPAAADIPAVDADVDAGELIAAKLPQILPIDDPSHSSQARSCSREPPRSNQDLDWGQDAHDDSMGTCGAQ